MVAALLGEKLSMQEEVAALHEELEALYAEHDAEMEANLQQSILLENDVVILTEKVSTLNAKNGLLEESVALQKKQMAQMSQAMVPAQETTQMAQMQCDDQHPTEAARAATLQPVNTATLNQPPPSASNPLLNAFPI